MTDNTCDLRIQPAQNDPRPVAEIIATAISNAPPLLAWADPDPLHINLTNRSGRREDFQPLMRGASLLWPHDLRLLEARLFWRDAALHVVARDDGGCRWTRIEERAGTEFRREEFSVHPIRDRQRFGLSDSDDATIKNLMAIEYRQRGRLVAWRLMIEEV